MTRPVRVVGRLTVVLTALAVLLAYPAWWWFGVFGWEALAYCVVACLIPGFVLSLVSGRVSGASRVVQLLLIGTALRVGFVAGVGLFVVAWRPELRDVAFLLALSLFYFAALTVETRELLVESQSSVEASADTTE